MTRSLAAGEYGAPFWYQMDSGRTRPQKTPWAPSSEGPWSAPAHRLVVRQAIREERSAICRMRHEVFARELGQYDLRPDGFLTDALDAFNVYLVVFDGKGVIGFISVTPPGHGAYSVDKYLPRNQLPFPVDDRLYEVRVLTIPKTSRRWILALTLMYASFRWVESHGGTRIMAMGRHEVLSMYHRVGLKNAGPTLHAGAVTYHLLQATMPDIHEALHGIRELLYRVEAEVEWQLGFPYRTPITSIHGGPFAAIVGEKVETREPRGKTINTQVLDV
jgi:hypothetical protein